MQKMAVLIETNVDYLIFSSFFSDQDFSGCNSFFYQGIKIFPQ
jgi:hypothetical protein